MLEIRDENYYCLCPDIADQSTEMVPLASIYQDIHLKDGVKYEFPKLVERCNLLGIPNAEIDLLKIFLLDFIIANEDRHSFNISFLRDSDTLEWLGVAPVYDSGKSMFVNKLDFEIDMTSSFRIGAKPFENTQAAQFKALPMEKLAGLVDFSSLSDICKWYKKFLAPLRRLPAEKKDALARKLGERIKETELLIREKQAESYAVAERKGKSRAESGSGGHSKSGQVNGGFANGSLFVSEPEAEYSAGKNISFASQAATPSASYTTESKITAPRAHRRKNTPEELVYTALIQEPTQTKEQLASRLELSRATITRALQKLTAQGRIRREGANKNGRWVVL